MKGFESIKRNLLDMKLKQKLLISYVLFLVLPLVVFTLLFYSRAASTLREQTIISAGQVYNDSIAKLANTTGSMVDIMDQFTLNASLNKILAKNSYSSYAEQLADYGTVIDFLDNIERSQKGLRVHVYFREQFETTTDNYHTHLVDSVRGEEWFKRMNEGGTSLTWFGNSASGSPYLSVGRPIWDLKNLRHMIGLIKVDVPLSLVQSIMSEALLEQSGEAFLIESDGNVLTTVGSKLVEPSDWAELESRSSTSEFMIHQQAIQGTDWKLVSLLPMKHVLRHVTALRNQMLLILLFIALFGCLTALYVANLNTKRMGRLIRKMRNLHIDDMEPLTDRHGNDEIGELIHNFNGMIKHIKQLAGERFESGKALKNTELRLLQSQINPHLLYNSLDVINIMAIEHGAQDISRMVRALSAFYKLGLNNGRDLVTLSDEAEHARVYVEIQNIRYEEGIRLLVNIHDSCSRCCLPKLTLQPLVENAVIHGILETDGRSGTIVISAEREGDSLVLTVSDNGVGMDKETCEKLFTPRHASDKSGYGMFNVNERIRLSFGERYGIQARSVPNVETEIRIEIPFIEEDNSDEQSLAQADLPDS